MKEDLTLFILSTGNNPNFEDCVLALKNQTMLAKIDIISEYAPLSLASQEMINRCTTKYYIQVDEDMILNADSVEKMYNAIDRSDEKTSMIAFMLHDTHLDFNICGIKIYKHKIFKKFPYNLNIISCEMEQLNRMKEEGFHYCFESYSDWNEIKDKKFHKLRLSYLKSVEDLEKYVKQKTINE